MSRKEIIKQWIQKNGNRCPICGRELNIDECVIDHIFSRSMGGTDEINNLQILCRRCNMVKGSTPFLGYKFEKYIQQLLELNDKYSNIKNSIKINNDIIDPDIIFERVTENGTEILIAEVKIANSITERATYQIIKKLKSYKEILPSAKPVFITPNELPESYVRLFKNNNVELWDKHFLAEEFKEQIVISKPESFGIFFELPKDKINVVDEYQTLIDSLKSCPTGWDNWVDYQKLIGKILEFLFCPPLNSPIEQSNDKSKKNRRDFILPNYSKENDTWKFLRERYEADYVVVDAKNSGKNISKNDVLQVANYLKKTGTGMFGLIIARKGTNSASETVLTDMWIHQQKMIIVLNDVDIEQMILDKKNGLDPARLILTKIQEFRLSV